VTVRARASGDETDYQDDDREHGQHDQQLDRVVLQLSWVVQHHATASASLAGWELGMVVDRVARYLASSRRAVPGW
jgi:hypothetical protein